MALPFGCPEGTIFAPFDNRGSCDVGRGTARPGAGAASSDGRGGPARAAPRMVLGGTPAVLTDFLERHARRALMVGTPPVGESGAPLGPIGPARYAVVPQARRPAAVRELLDALDPQRPFVWDGGPLDAHPAADRPDAVLCTRLPTREQFATLARLGEPALFVTAAQLPYLRSLAAPLTPLELPSAADRARDRTEALREQVARRLREGGGGAGLAVLGPRFERFDPAQAAAALLAIGRQPLPPPPTQALPTPAASGIKLFVNL